MAADYSKILLDESEMPTQWYNVIPDLPTPPPPPLHPGTHEPIGPDDLAPLWQNALVFFACVAATRAGVGVFGSEESERPTPARSETESGGGDGPR